jgi:fermentation-respiration switch protein FrsA (DUF1100 family)
MAWLKWLVIALCIYGAFVALLYIAQRALMYFPERVRTPPAQAGLPQAEELVLDTADGERVIVWHVSPRGDKPVVLYFHGNGASLRYRVGRFRALIADGTGLLALSYRGYGGSSGSPSEAGLIADGAAVYDFAAARYPAARLAFWGESLGGAVALALAVDRPVGRVVLEAQFTSAADVAAAVYPIVPVRLLMKDQFRSDQRIGRIRAPLLMLHGALDRVISLSFGERLYALAPEPKRFVRFPLGGHEDLDQHGALDVVREFLAEKDK